MKIYVDFVRATGVYQAAREASWVDAATPAAVLVAPAFLEASGLGPVAGNRRLYHVERARFVDAACLGEADVSDGDTVVVVNTDDPTFEDPRAVDALWEVTGGARRRPPSMLH